MTAADAYFSMATFAIGMAKNAADLRAWWSKEQAHRLDYGLSDSQFDRLVALCKDKVNELEAAGDDGGQQKKTTPPPQRRTRAAI